MDCTSFRAVTSHSRGTTPLEGRDNPADRATFRVGRLTAVEATAGGNLNLGLGTRAYLDVGSACGRVDVLVNVNLPRRHRVVAVERRRRLDKRYRDGLVTGRLLEVQGLV